MQIRVKKLTADDLQTRVDWINNPIINSTMYFDLPANIEKTKKWYKTTINNQTRTDLVFKNTEDQIIAMGGFTSINNEDKNAEFYVMVHPEMHGKGIGSYVSKWLFNYGFSVLNLHKIYLYTNEDNTKAYAIYENSGFTLEGVLRLHRFKNLVFKNRRIYGLLQSEWECLPWKKIIKNEI